MLVSETRRLLRPIWLTPFVALLATTAPAAADWLVTREGHRIETQGAWEIKGRSVVFTRAGGELASVRLDEIDLDASREASTAPPLDAPAAPRAASKAPRQPVMMIDNSVVGEASESPADGPGELAGNFRDAIENDDLDAAMRLVRWGETPEHFRNLTRQSFDQLTTGQIRDVRLEEATGESMASFGAGNKTYEPSVEVTHRLVVELEPDDAENIVTMRFPVGAHLGSYFIAAPTAR